MKQLELAVTSPRWTWLTYFSNHSSVKHDRACCIAKALSPRKLPLCKSRVVPCEMSNLMAQIALESLQRLVQEVAGLRDFACLCVAGFRKCTEVQRTRLCCEQSPRSSLQLWPPPSNQDAFVVLYENRHPFPTSRSMTVNLLSSLSRRFANVPMFTCCDTQEIYG